MSGITAINRVANPSDRIRINDTGVLTDRGLVNITAAVNKSYTPQLTKQGIIDEFDALRARLDPTVRAKLRTAWRTQKTR